MKKMIAFIILFIFLYVAYVYRSNIYNFYYTYCVPIEKKVSTLEKNKYFREYNFNYVANTNNFIPNSKQEILNIYYTVINSGMENFTFYCPKDYYNCLVDVNDIANNQETLSSINNFIHPYNSFKTIETEISTTGEINLRIHKVYDDKMIYLIEYEVDKIINKNITNNMNDEQKIRKIHDYIINHTKYDKERTDNKINKYSSDNAYGVLTENYGVCGGYTDAMMLFLERFNIKSIKISSENHIWNYVNVNNKWLHLDLTWDDPISSDGKDILDDTYFLISDRNLKKLNSTEHEYNENIYN